MPIDFKDNSPELLHRLDDAVENSLTIIGQKMETYAKEHLTMSKAVDTGLLRNSVTYALDGKPPAISSYRASRGEGSGEYSGTAPTDDGDARSVYVGTNVEYGPYIEFGTSRMAPRPFIRPAVQNYNSEYEHILQNEIKKAISG